MQFTTRRVSIIFDLYSAGMKINLEHISMKKTYFDKDSDIYKELENLHFIISGVTSKPIGPKDTKLKKKSKL